MINNYFKIPLSLSAVCVCLISGTFEGAYPQDAPVSSTPTIDWHSSTRSFDLDKQAYIGQEFTFKCSAAAVDFTPNQLNA